MKTKAGEMTSAAGSMPTTGRYDWYRDHTGAEFQRVSTLIKKVNTDTYNLELWAKRQVLVGVSRRDDLIAGAKAMKPHPVTGWSDLQKKDLNKLVERAEEAAKDSDGALIGTAMHTLTERLDQGEPLEDIVRGLPHQMEMDLRAYAKLIELNGWQIIEVERTVINDELAVGGTFDRVYGIPGLAALLGAGQCQHDHQHGAGRDELPVIGDVKTEKSPEKNGLHIGPQCAIYSRARRMWLPTPEYVPAPCVRQDVAVVVHVKDGHAVPYFVNLRDGWEAAKAARVQYNREKAARDWLAPMPNIREPRPAEVLTETAAARRAPLTVPPLRPAAPVAEVAIEVAPGVVSWEPEEPIGTYLGAGGAPGALDDVDKQAVDTVWAAGDLAALGRVWEIYTQTIGRTWGGRVAEAADARRRQIECPQRAMHTTGRCACGWAQGVPA